MLTSVFRFGLVWLAKLYPRKSRKRLTLANYEYRAKRRKGYAFETVKNHDSADNAPDFKDDFSLKRAPTIPLETFEGYGNTVLENVVWVLSVQDASFHSLLQRRPCVATSANSGQDQIRSTPDGTFSVHDRFGQRWRGEQRRICRAC